MTFPKEKGESGFQLSPGRWIVAYRLTTTALHTSLPNRVKRYRAIRRWCGSMSVVPRKRPNRGQVANDEKGQKATSGLAIITNYVRPDF